MWALVVWGLPTSVGIVKWPEPLIENEQDKKYAAVSTLQNGTTPLPSFVSWDLIFRHENALFAIVKFDIFWILTPFLIYHAARGIIQNSTGQIL